MAKIQKSIDVEVPVSIAYDQWTQFEEFPKFMEGVVEVRQTDDKHVQWTAEVGGERHSWVAEIVEQEPDRVIAWRAIDGVPNTGRVTFEPIENGARASVEMEYEPEGFKEKVGAFLGIDEGQVEDDLERFKDLVESRELPTGAWRGSIESGSVVESDRSSAR
jgi:uncharacterized membrane protein